MKRQEEFYDRATADLTPVQVREKLVKLAGEVPSIEQDKLPAILDLVTYKSTPNGGVDVTDDVKWHSASLSFLFSLFSFLSLSVIIILNNNSHSLRFSQSNSLVRTECMLHPLQFGMASRMIRSDPPGWIPSGPSSSLITSRLEDEERNLSSSPSSHTLLVLVSPKGGSLGLQYGDRKRISYSFFLLNDKFVLHISVYCVVSSRSK